MEFDFLQIDLFQLNNLLNNRVPFVAVAVDCEFAPKELGDALFVKKLKFAAKDQENIESWLTSVMDTYPNHAHIWICDDGTKSKELVQRVTAGRKVNAFYLSGGLTQLRQPTAY